MLELAILGLLKEHEMHGYELKKRLADTLGFASGVSFGSLYPALARLEAAGAVKAVDDAGGPAPLAIPLTGSLGGELAAFRARKAATRGRRGKKVYGITDKGEALFEELLAAENQPNDDGRLFSLRLGFARYLSPDARLRMLDRRRVHLSERVAKIRTRIKAQPDPDSYTASVLEHDREAAENDLSWIERLIASERARGQVEADVARPRRRAITGAAKSEAQSPSISGLRPVTTQEDTTQ
jgi:DNA-binding PadR family transcriptional regulator